MERLELRIGTAGERLALETYRDGATVLEVLDADRRPANGARVLPAELEILGAVISHRALAVRDPVAGAGDSPRGEDLDRILRWALERLMAAEPGAASAVLVAAREETGIGLEAFWLSDRGRR